MTIARMSLSAIYQWPAVRRLHRRDDGASLIEYALLVALIAIVCFAAISFFGSATDTKFSDVANSVSGV